MNKLILVGDPGSKRTEYFTKAVDQVAQELHLSVDYQVLSWQEGTAERLRGAVVKLDPPPVFDADFLQMHHSLKGYQEHLAALQSSAGGEPEKIRFLNSPQAILTALDKGTCKQMLMEHGIPTTRSLCGKRIYKDIDQLHRIMCREHTYSVFLKPVDHSGAAGIVAYRWNPQREISHAYTSVCLEGNHLVHTKRIRHLTGQEQIEPILRQLLKGEILVEKWYPKAEYRGNKYDLRVVWQFGRSAYMVGRQSKYPITNLDLNNHALPLECLQLSGTTLQEIRQLCDDTMACFADMSVAGIDVMLDKNTCKPRVIEVNGQGDLLHQDIYQENQIYREQVERMLAMSD
ncbi:MAG: STM4014 family protein [Eubacteriales bacterium]|nr:STM4014 family protein [Eubacteriales bacterium]